MNAIKDFIIKVRYIILVLVLYFIFSAWRGGLGTYFSEKILDYRLSSDTCSVVGVKAYRDRRWCHTQYHRIDVLYFKVDNVRYEAIMPRNPYPVGTKFRVLYKLSDPKLNRVVIPDSLKGKVFYRNVY